MEYIGDNKSGLPIYKHNNGWSVVVNSFIEPIEVLVIIDRGKGNYLKGGKI